MLDILLKHVVAEASINVFFDTVFNNFVKPEIKERLVRVFKIHAKERKLRSGFTLEIQSDMEVMHGIPDWVMKEIEKELFKECPAIEKAGYKGSSESDAPIIFYPHSTDIL